MFAELLVTILLGAAPVRVGPCAPDSKPWRQANAALTKLDELIENATGEEDLGKARAGLERLMRHRCFVGTREAPRPFEDASLVAFKTWWRDGGHAWLLSYLQSLAPGASALREARVPPDLRSELIVPSDHPLHAIACADASTAPGCEAGDHWRDQMQHELEIAHANDLKKNWRERPPPACDALMSEVVAAERFTFWRDCIESRRPRVPALPLGRWRLPSEGWLVVRGRRGHYDFCDEVRAYSLSSGAAYFSTSCTDLALRDGGFVDRAATNATRVEKVRVGSLPVAQVQATALTILTMPYVEDHVQRFLWTVPLPAELEPNWNRRELEARDPGPSGRLWMNSGQTLLTWSFVGAEGVAGGKLTWAHSSDAAEEVAAERLRNLEASFKESCPPEPLPAGLIAQSSAPGVNRLDAPGGVRDVQEHLENALVDWTPPPACKR